MAQPTYEELLAWLKPSSPAPRELEWAESITGDEYTIFLEKLNNINEEGYETFIKSGVSGFIRMGDCVVGIFSAQGDLVSAKSTAAFQILSASLPIKYVMKHWTNDPTVGVRDGDLFYNCEQAYGGMHNPDQALFMPIFHEGRLVAWTCAIVHEPETGAVEPGGMPASAMSRYYEGMRIPPLKIGENFRLRNDVLEMIGNFVRTREFTLTNIRARAAVCDRVRRRILSLAQEKGEKFITGLFRRIIVDAEKAARERIRGWNDGVARAVICDDKTPATGAEGMRRTVLTVRKHGDRVLMDFTGTSPESPGTCNAPSHVVACLSAVYIFAHPFSDLPISSGSFAPFDFYFPKDCYMNPAPDAAVSDCFPTSGVIFNLQAVTFAKLMFSSDQRDRIGGTGGVGGTLPIVAGVNQWGQPFGDMMAFTWNSCGQTARHDRDGMDAFSLCYMPGSSTPDVEDTEQMQPLLVIFQGHGMDACGLGKYRGGVSGDVAFVVYGVPMMAYAPVGMCGNKIYSGQGIFGGYPGHPMPTIIIRNSKIVDLLANGDPQVPRNLQTLLAGREHLGGEWQVSRNAMFTTLLNQGDLVLCQSNISSGYGDPLERDPELVCSDVRNQVVSSWAAEQVYRVALNRDTGEVDTEQTRAWRAAERQQRLNDSLSFTEFEQRWQGRRPNPAVLHSYGTWPDAQPERPIIRI